MKLFAKTLLTLTLMAGGMISFAQSVPLNVNNQTDCYYLITAVAVEGACTNPCTTQTICIPPHSSVSLNPCGPPDLIWCNLQVTPADADCQPCRPSSDYPTVYVSAPNDPCAPFPHMDSGKHCHDKCGSFTVDFHSPQDADIIP